MLMSQEPSRDNDLAVLSLVQRVQSIVKSCTVKSVITTAVIDDKRAVFERDNMAKAKITGSVIECHLSYGRCSDLLVCGNGFQGWALGEIVLSFGAADYSDSFFSGNVINVKHPLVAGIGFMHIVCNGILHIKLITCSIQRSTVSVIRIQGRLGIHYLQIAIACILSAVV